MITPYSIKVQFWLEEDDDPLGMSGKFIELIVKLDSIDGYWEESEDEISLLISGNVFYVENEESLINFLKQYFNPIKL